MGAFNEWITKRHGELPELATTPNLGMETNSDEELVANQLEQLVNRVTGLLHNVSEDKREHLVNVFISNLQARL